MRTYIAVEPDYSRVLVGFWCEDCQLPSVVQVPVLLLTIDGVTNGGTVSRCANCEGEDEDGDLYGR